MTLANESDTYYQKFEAFLFTSELTFFAYVCSLKKKQSNCAILHIQIVAYYTFQMTSIMLQIV